MKYRRFGKTEAMLSEITLGGMRFLHCWEGEREDLPEDSIRNCYEITEYALNQGINHIETAYGYNKSEGLFGKVLPQLKKREDYYLMTKGSGQDPDEFKRRIEEQLKTLNTTYFDFYAYHGINNREILDQVIRDDRMLKVMRDYRDQGIFRHAGFSTHAFTDIIEETIRTDFFDFVNLHYYYFNQMNHSCLELAAARDMGILIISPNDKGGQLWKASEKMQKACSPLTPVRFNGLFCLAEPAVTTLSMGFHEIEQFTDPLGIVADTPGIDEEYQAAKSRMDTLKEQAGESYCTVCARCLPCPAGINIPHILRMWNMYRYYDMQNFCRYRYNMFKPDDHWFKGTFADTCTHCGDCLPRCPEKLEIPTLIEQAHKTFYIPPVS